MNLHPFYVAIYRTNSYRTNDFRKPKPMTRKISDFLLTVVALAAAALTLGLAL